jgi:hypothetical protein
MRVPFGGWAWRPDQDVLNAQSLTDVRNAIPTGTHWQPQKSGAPIGTQEITGPIQGMTTAARNDGSLEVFVVSAGRAYRIPSRTGALQAVASDYYSYATFNTQETTRWSFLPYGGLLIGTNYLDDIQGYDLVGGGLMVPLSVEAPKAKYIAQVRDFPVVAYTNDPDNGEDPYQSRWPGIVDGVIDPTEWTLATGSQADFQRWHDIGPTTGLTGGQFGTLIGENGVATMQYGGNALFQFDTKERRIGCRIPNSVTQYRQVTYFAGTEGFQAFDGQKLHPIGAEKIDRWFADDFVVGLQHLMWSGIDYARGHILWLYAGRGHAGKPNRLLRYCPQIDQFTLSDITADALGSGKTFGADLDDEEAFPDLDAGDIDLDDPSIWDAIAQTVMVQDGFLSAFVGAALPGSWETALMQASPDSRAILTKALVGHAGGAPGLRVARGEQFGDGLTWSTTHGKQSDGYLRFREPGRTHKLRVSLSGAWTRAEFVDIFASPIGGR